MFVVQSNDITLNLPEVNELLSHERITRNKQNDIVVVVLAVASYQKLLDKLRSKSIQMTMYRSI